MSSEKSKTIIGYILECFSLLDNPEKLIRATDLLLNIINTEIEFLESMKRHVINLGDIGREGK